MQKILISIIFITIITSCANLNKKECVGQNWFLRGHKDALLGKIKPQTEKYRKSCSKYKIQIKSFEYIKGFEIGLKKYCTHRNALNRGLNGDERHLLCDETSENYKNTYDTGYKEYLATDRKI